MPASNPYAHSPNSAVLTLSFELLQQVVQQCLFAGSRTPLVLSATSRDGTQRCEAHLSRCLVKPALRNQCALVFVFNQLTISGPLHNVGEGNAELACLVDLVEDNEWGGEEPFLTFGRRLLAERELTASASATGSIWPQYPGLAQEATALLLPALEQLVREQLRINLCQLEGYRHAANDPAALWNATLGSFRVVTGLTPRLDLYYHAADGSRGHGPSLTTALPLGGSATAGLLIGNEHLLYHLVLPALQHLYLDYLQPAAFLDPSQPEFRDLFHISGAADEAHLGALQATNTVLLKPLHAHVGHERTHGVSHFVNPGDLTIELNGRVKVTAIYTLMPVQTEPESPALLIKIKQTYAFGLRPMEEGLAGMELESHDLQVWAVATDTTFSTQATAFAKRVVEQYVVQQAVATVFKWVLSLVPRLGQHRLPRGLQAAAPAATTVAAVIVPPVPLTVKFALPVYRVSQLEPFAKTPEPASALPAAPAPAGAARRLLEATEPSTVPSYTVDLRHNEAIAELTRRLVEWKTADNALLEFYATNLRGLLLHLLVRSNPSLAPVHDYLLGFVSHYWAFGAYWNQFLLKRSGIDLTVNALLARQFYGDDYLDRSLLGQATRRGLQWVVDAALQPLLHSQNSTLLSATMRADGLYAQFNCQAAAVTKPIGPVRDGQPAPDAPVQSENKNQQREDRLRNEREKLDMEDLHNEFKDFWVEKPDTPEQQQVLEKEKALQQLEQTEPVAQAFLEYAAREARVLGPPSAETENRQLELSNALSQAIATAGEGIKQSYRAQHNDAVLRLRLRERWEQPEFSTTSLPPLRKQAMENMLQLQKEAGSRSASGWGKEDDPGENKYYLSLTADFAQCLAVLQKAAELFVQTGKSLNSNLFFAYQQVRMEVLPELHWEQDDRNPVYAV